MKSGPCPQDIIDIESHLNDVQTDDDDESIFDTDVKRFFQKSRIVNGVFSQKSVENCASRGVCV